ncbi:hypothetical protein Slin15195_G031520 [Septoria linicola]|uniref:Uncharacterized protein n=1 Tax=Septoria linicola TaxID=215465 RepID=A0A9Q9EI06_9PEZI|nr:hypothetical protein Slin14017_G030540 [Septoria linicola]USW49833.1 hypothetical protein Slin15195_G031520 [Septoria linicola]
MAAGPHSKRAKYYDAARPIAAKETPLSGVASTLDPTLRAASAQGGPLPDDTSLPDPLSPPKTTSPGIAMAGGLAGPLSQNAQTAVQVLRLVSSAAQQASEVDNGAHADALSDCFVSAANDFIQSDPSEYTVLMTDYLQDTTEEVVATDMTPRDRALKLLWNAYRQLRRLDTEDMKILTLQARAVDKMFGCIGQLQKASKTTNAEKSMG